MKWKRNKWKMEKKYYFMKLLMFLFFSALFSFSHFFSLSLFFSLLLFMFASCLHCRIFYKFTLCQNRHVFAYHANRLSPCFTFAYLFINLRFSLSLSLSLSLPLPLFPSHFTLIVFIQWRSFENSILNSWLLFNKNRWETEMVKHREKKKKKKCFKKIYR